MSDTRTQHPLAGAHDGARSRPEDHERRRGDLDRDLVAILGMLAILALTVLCFLGQNALPL
jgi:hypothetical protein